MGKKKLEAGDFETDFSRESDMNVKAKAILTVCSNSENATEAATLLDMLGLTKTLHDSYRPEGVQDALF